MQSVFKKLNKMMLLICFLAVAACASNKQSSASDTKTAAKTPSGTIVIDETQVMWIVGGDVGGGTLEFQGKSYKFKMDGVKLGGFGVHKVKLAGDVYDLNDVADFAGVYSEAEIGFTVADADKGDSWWKNDKGAKLRLKSPKGKGIDLDVGVDGVDIRLK